MKGTYTTGYKANLEVFSSTLQELATEDDQILVVTSDSRGSGKLVPFGEKFPGRIIETGIAEQNLVGISAGLASTGKIVFAVSPACFLTARALEQIKNDVAYSDQPVRLIGISAGVSYGALGSTHHSLHDLAALRAIHNLIICAPADNMETEKAIRLAAETDQPLYIRFGKKPMPFLYHHDIDFAFGKALKVKEGREVAIIATGETVYPSLEAASELEENYNLSTRVISMHTIKPLDREMLADTANRCRALLTVEEHSIFGGLGEACATCLMELGYFMPFARIGIPDEYTITGSQNDIFDHYGLNGKGIAQKAIQLLKKNKKS